jgi:hypothetical protein
MPVFSSGTANTVAFLNASKVLSSSTSLSFDGSNLGIGVPSPAATLDVYGGASGRLQIYSSASGNFLTSKVAANTGYQILNYLGSQHVWGDGTNTKMVIDASGNVGVGIIIPAYLLHVKGGGIGVTSADGTVTSLLNYNSIGTVTNTDFVVNTNSIERARISSTGLAVTGALSATGTTTIGNGVGSGILAINGQAANSRAILGQTVGTNRWIMYLGNPTAETGSDAGSNFQLFAVSDAGAGIDNPILITRASGGSIALGGTSNRPVTSTGNFMVGATSSSAIANRNIDVNGTGDASFNVRVGGTTCAYFYSTAGQTLLGTNIEIPITFNPNNIERMRIGTNGIVTIGNAIAATNVELYLNGVASKAQRIVFRESGVTKWLIGQGAASETDAFELYNANGQMALTFAKASSNATFYGSVNTGRLNVTNNSAYAIEVYGTGLVQDAPSGNNDHIATTRVRIGYMRDTNIGTIGSNGGDSGLSFLTHSTSTGWKESVRIQPSGNVGIGNTNPAYKLHVSGTIGVNSGYTSGNFGLFVQGLGAGSADARAAHFRGFGGHTTIGGTGPTIVLQNADGTNGNITKLSFETASNGEAVSINCINTDHGNFYGDMAFNTRGSAGYSEKLRITANGNVGIGTDNPTYKLHVTGSTYINGNFLQSALTSYQQQVISLSLNSTGWVKLFTMDSPGGCRVRYRAGSQNSEEIGEFTVKATYVAAGTQLTWSRQTYYHNINEIRVTGSNAGPFTVWALVRTTDFAPNLWWQVLEGNSYIALHNAVETPGTAISSITGPGYNSTNFIGDATFTGNVGIGITNPTAKLTIKGQTHTAPWLAVERSGSGTLQLRMFNVEDTGYTASSGTVSAPWTNVIDSSNSDFMITTNLGGGTGGNIVLDGKVGIGTTAPQDKLHVAGVIRSNASGTGTLYLGQTGGGATYVAASLVATASTIYAPVGKLSFRLPTHGANTDYGLTEQMAIEGTGADSRGAYKLTVLPHGGRFTFGGTNVNSGKVKFALTSSGLGNVTSPASFGVNGVFSIGGVTNNNEGFYLGTGGADGDGIAAGIGFLREASGWSSALSFYTNNVTSGPNGVSAMQEKARLTSNGTFAVGQVGTTNGTGVSLQPNLATGTVGHSGSFATVWNIPTGTVGLFTVHMGGNAQYGGAALFFVTYGAYAPGGNATVTQIVAPQGDQSGYNWSWQVAANGQFQMRNNTNSVAFLPVIAMITLG